jgi:hypothetical protein
MKTGIAYMAATMLHDDEEEEKPFVQNGMGKKEYNPMFREQEENDKYTEMAFNFSSNLVNEMLESGVMMTDPEQILGVLGKRNALFSRVEDLTGFEVSIKNMMGGKDEILSGPNAGESKVFNQILKGAGFPKIFTSKYLGGETMMVRDFTPQSGPETWFNTDMKNDLDELDRTRKIERNRYKIELEEYYDYDNLSKVEKYQIDKRIEFQLKMHLGSELNLPLREDYNDDQSRK